MKNYNTVYKNLSWLILGTTSIILNGCNNGSNAIGGNGTENVNTAYFKGIKTVPDPDSINMNIAWTMDGAPLNTGVTLHDIAWHLVTLTVEDRTTPLEPPLPIKGVQAIIYPMPNPNIRGESIEVADINCKTAQFSKNGDTCSAYVRATYDLSTGTDNPPSIPVQIATYAYDDGLSAMVQLRYQPLFTYPQGDYRVVAPIEAKYYAGSAIAANPGQYQILDMQNISLPSLTITTISNLTNPAFTLMNRQTESGIDPYYGPYSQCSLTANPALNKVNYLPSLGSECILIYQAAESSTQAMQTDTVTLATDAGTTAPWTNNTLDLLANYAPGTPIPDNIKNGANFLVSSGSATPNGTDMVMKTDGVLASGTIDPSIMPFKLVNIQYDFVASQLLKAPYYGNPIPYYQNGVINIANQEIQSCVDFGMCDFIKTFFAGQQIVTDASATNPVTVGKVTQALVPGSAGSASGRVTSCGGGDTSSTVTISPTSIDQVHQGNVHIHMDNNSNGHCAGSAPLTYDADVPYAPNITGNTVTIYNVDDHGCSGGQWDIGGKVSFSPNGCNGDNCSYTVTVEASHGGVGGQCQDRKTSSFDVHFLRPQIYMQLSQLGNFTPQTLNPNPDGVGVFKQNLNAMLGTQGGLVAETITCPQGSSTCNSNGLYSNGLSATNMSYNIGLSAGDTLKDGIVNFTRTDGYDLSNFIISH